MRAGFGFLFPAASKKETALALFLPICYHSDVKATTLLTQPSREKKA